jgi:putative hydrolase of the HAD superfamily
MTDVRGVTLDLDDTLFAQREWLSGAWCAVADRATELGLDGTALHRALLQVAAEGTDRGSIIDRALLATGTRPQPYVADLVEAFTAHAPAHLPAYPGALDALARLRTRVPVVLVTDGNPRIQRAKIAALGLGHLLADGVVISDELGGRATRKPSPVPFRRALELLGRPAEAVVHVGDRPGKDVAGARAAGVRSVRVRTGEYAAVDDPGAAPWAEAASFAAAVDLLEPYLAGTTECHLGL